MHPRPILTKNVGRKISRGGNGKTRPKNSAIKPPSALSVSFWKSKWAHAADTHDPNPTFPLRGSCPPGPPWLRPCYSSFKMTLFSVMDATIFRPKRSRKHHDFHHNLVSPRMWCFAAKSLEICINFKEPPWLRIPLHPLTAADVFHGQPLFQHGGKKNKRWL